MNYILKYKLQVFIVLLFLLVFSAFTLEKKEGNNNKNKLAKTSQTAGDAYRLEVNKLSIGLNNRGVLANVDIGGLDGGFFDGKEFLFSGGFFLSGKYNGILFSNAVASASRIEDYSAGTVDGKSKTIYIVKSSDDPFSESWMEWKTAVEAGAYFYDGDNDGEYNPVDKNGNSLWDTDEDKPDILGDETVWCVFNDGVKSSDRSEGFRENIPLGIEVRQTIWGYATSGDLGNILFVRYSIVNRGKVAETLDSVYFGVWADPDLGGESGYSDDLVGCDVALNAGYVYNDGPDPVFGANPPAFMIDFFQGPWEYTGNNADTAYNRKGVFLGIDTIVGARNLPLTSFVQYIQGDPTQGDPDNTQQMRNYTLGKSQAGTIVDPCNWQFGTVLSGSCSAIDGRFMYSGDPVAGTGWVNSGPNDQRQMSNTGPFRLIKDQAVDIVVAYVVGRSTTALASLSETRRIDQAAQFVYDNNFRTATPPPAVVPIVKTTDNSIELVWDTPRQVAFTDEGYDEGGNKVYAVKFEGFEVYMFNKNSTALQEGGLQNAKLIARYDLANSINTVIVEDGKTKERKVLFEPGIQLDSAMYADPNTGRIKLSITTDPFTNGPLIKGKPYFLAIVGYALNPDIIVPLDQEGTVLLPGTAFTQYTSNKAVIINGGIVPGTDTNTPFRAGVEAEHTFGQADVAIRYSVVDKRAVKGSEYQVTFEKDQSVSDYELFYSITDVTNGVVLADSLKNYNSEEVNYLYDGVTLNVDWVSPKLKGLQLQDGAEKWFSSDTTRNEVGPFYMGSDYLEVNGRPLTISGRSTKYSTVDKMRRVELRFGVPGKAYRYVRGLTTRWVYPGDAGNGFVDVPFQAWVVDKEHNEEYQVAVGFTETSNALDTLGKPDGLWDPKKDVSQTKEYIVIFGSRYDPQGSNLAYTGTGTGAAAAKWAEIATGYNMDVNNPATTPELQALAKSAWFDAMYVVGLNRLNDTEPFSPAGKLVIELDKYPLTPEDIFKYKVNVDLSAEERKSQFDKVNVFPNPLFAFNSAASYTGQAFDDPYVTFSNLPEEVTVKIYTLSGTLIRTLQKNETNPFLRWDLRNEDNLRIASGMYIAIVSNPEMGDKVLKFAVIMPQKQILNY